MLGFSDLDTGVLRVIVMIFIDIRKADAVANA
jgi:hypothetical protein